MSVSRGRRQEDDSLRSVYLVARREFVIRVRSRVYRIGTGLIVLLLIALVVIEKGIPHTSGSVTTIGFAGAARTLSQPLKATAPGRGLDLAVRRLSSDNSGRSQVRSGKLDVLVTGSPLAPDVVATGQLDPTLQTLLTDLVAERVLTAQVSARGINPRPIVAAVTGATVHVHILKPSGPQNVQRTIMGVIAAVALFVSLQIYGTQVGQGVAEEKESRIVEILLATVRPGQLLFGKVLGIGLVGMLQLAIVGAAGLILIAKTHVVTLPALGVSVVAADLLWFALGFTLYAVLFAAAGSLVSRVQDVQLASLPIILGVVVAYVSSLVVVLPDPNGLAATVLSLVPFLAPVAMPTRMAAGDVPAWQVVLAIVLTLGAIVAATRLAARIYGNSVLRTGTRVGLAEALRRS